MTRKAGEPNFVPTPLVQQTKQYLERFNSVKNKEATNAMRRWAPLSNQLFLLVNFQSGQSLKDAVWPGGREKATEGGAADSK